jgi:hypothetical protein
MSCKFDVYTNGKCYHAKQTPYGCICESKGCKLKNDSYPQKNKAQDENPSEGEFIRRWREIGIDPFSDEDVSDTYKLEAK